MVSVSRVGVSVRVCLWVCGAVVCVSVRLVVGVTLSAPTPTCDRGYQDTQKNVLIRKFIEVRFELSSFLGVICKAKS